MKRIVIYVHNEEMEALAPLRKSLEKKGAQVVCSALKYKEAQKADLVLTLPKYLKTVKEIFAGTDVPVNVIEEETPAAAAPVEAAPAAEEPAAPSAEEPVAPELVAVDVPADDVIVMTVGEAVVEDEAPKPAAARRR